MSQPRRPKAPQLTITVTADIIAKAMVKDSQHCMIAEAIGDSVPSAQRIAVDLATIRFTDPVKRLRYTYLTPRMAQTQLVRFDQGAAVEPFSFRIRNGHVTLAGMSSIRKEQKQLTDAQRQARLANLQKSRAVLKKTTIADRKASGGNVPDRVGGRPAPLQKTADGVPFSRRRAFGLRALQF